ncbi:MAG: RNA methyltransferase [Bacteroidales bacterium]|nr:RNA methyltransferase [Bacteroidales bacterium]
MLTKATIRLVVSLRQRKFRRQEGLFVAEGPRLVGELLSVFTCRHLLATREWLDLHDVRCKGMERTEVTAAELMRISSLQTPQQVVALFEIPREEALPSCALNELHLALDGVQDPGNLGTIIRLADWFGVHHLWCSPMTADVWNPKVVQATMGGIARVQVHYLDLPAFLASLPSDFPIYGTALDGQSIWQTPLANRGIIVMGNEGNGVTEEVDRLCRHRLLIPNYPPEQQTTESLNVAMATGIVLAEFRRRCSLSVTPP